MAARDNWNRMLDVMTGAAQARAAANPQVTYGPGLQPAPQAPPNILGPAYNNLPPQQGGGPLDYVFPDAVPSGYMPRDAIDKSLEDFSQQYIARPRK